jgi:hypothetical protein
MKLPAIESALPCTRMRLPTRLKETVNVVESGLVNSALSSMATPRDGNLTGVLVFPIAFVSFNESKQAKASKRLTTLYFK